MKGENNKPFLAELLSVGSKQLLTYGKQHAGISNWEGGGRRKFERAGGTCQDRAKEMRREKEEEKN